MSRSNPNEGGSNNPAKRWFEWNGEQGVVRYYDRDEKKNIEVGSDFTFLLLDQLGTIKGWHDASDSGIYANEVKDSRQEAFVVKAFKGGVLIEGIYRDIKDRVNALGGQFTANCYIAFKHNGGLEIGSLQFKGAALHAWAEFTKANRADLYKKAIRINGFTEGKKGRIVFRVPVFQVSELSPETNNIAVALDQELQQYLDAYFNRTKREQADEHDEQYDDEPESESDAPRAGAPLTDDDIPF